MSLEQCNFRRAQKKVDVCDACLYFDRSVKRQALTQIRATRSLLCERDPNRRAALDAVWRPRGLQALSTSGFRTAFLDHIGSRARRKKEAGTRRTRKEILDFHDAEARAEHVLRTELRAAA